jgi:uncharacterized protein with von Willebrand factor type A (vWA) domain
VVNAARAALEIRKLTREELLEIAERAEEKVLADTSRTAKAAEEMAGIDEDIEKTIKQKIKEAKDHWNEKVRNSNDPAEWAEATDDLNAKQCALMRLLRQLGGGRLPGEWYRLWVDLKCA